LEGKAKLQKATANKQAIKKQCYYKNVFCRKDYTPHWRASVLMHMEASIRYLKKASWLGNESLGKIKQLGQQGDIGHGGVGSVVVPFSRLYWCPLHLRRVMRCRVMQVGMHIYKYKRQYTDAADEQYNVKRW
jgi:hypothetical protein